MTFIEDAWLSLHPDYRQVPVPPLRVAALREDYKATLGRDFLLSPTPPADLIRAGWPTDAYSQMLAWATHGTTLGVPPHLDLRTRASWLFQDAWQATENGFPWSMFAPWIALGECHSIEGTVPEVRDWRPQRTSDGPTFLTTWLPAGRSGPLAYAAGLTPTEARFKRSHAMLRSLAALNGYTLLEGTQWLHTPTWPKPPAALTRADRRWGTAPSA